MNADAQAIRATPTALRERGVRRVIPCHCTGDEACTLLGEETVWVCRRGGAGFRALTAS